MTTSTPDRRASRTLRATARTVRSAAFLLLVTAALQASAATFLIAEPSEANYRVREQLAGISFPNDAVGVTDAITGRIAFGDDGAVLEGSVVTVELAGLTSDQSRRDGFVRNNTLRTATFPTAEFVPSAITGLTFPLPATGEAELQIVGELTIRDVTRTVTWTGVAVFDGEVAYLEAATTFDFTEFELTKPRVASVLSVADDITLEIRLHLVPSDE